MIDRKELKRLAEAIESCASISTDDESAWMRRSTGETVVELLEELDDLEELRIENHRLKLIEEAWKLQKDMPAAIGELMAENESLRKVATELRRFASCEHLHHDKPDQHEADEPCKVIIRLDAAMGLGK